MANGTWSLAFGIWREGIITSRDGDFISGFTTEAEAQQKLEEIRRNVRQIGYSIQWHKIKQERSSGEHAANASPETGHPNG